MNLQSISFSNNPPYFALLIFGIAVFLMLLSSLFSYSTDWSWKIAASAMLFYSVATVIFSLKQKHFKKYLIRAVISVLLFEALLIFFAWFFSANPKEHLQLYIRIYSCLLVFFFMLAGLSILMKGMLRWVGVDKLDK